jgi:hypothetical protein
MGNAGHEPDEHEAMHAWLGKLGLAFAKGHRRDLEVLPDGRALIVSEYPTLPDLLFVVEAIEAIVGMAQEDALAIAEEASE